MRVIVLTLGSTSARDVYRYISNVSWPFSTREVIFPELDLNICDLQPALQCAIRGARGVLPCVGWGVRPVNWIYRL